MTGALLDLAVDVVAGVGCPQALSVGFREGEDNEAFWQVFLGPSDELGLTFGVGFPLKRKDGARRMRGSGKAAMGVLWSARDLRVGIG